MRTQLRNALLGALIGGGIAVLSVSVASAAETDGEDSILGGSQALLGIELPVTVGGNAIAVIGDSSSSDSGQASPAAPAAPAERAPTTSGTDGVGAGTQAVAPVTVPITIGGNSISLLGDAASTGSEPDPAAADQAGDSAESTDPRTDGTDGVLAGTQVAAPLSLPVQVEGNSISVIGDTSTGGPQGPGAVDDPGDTEGPSDPGTPGEPTEPGDSRPAAVTETAALAITGAGVVSPIAGLAATGLGLLLIGARRILTVLRH